MARAKPRASILIPAHNEAAVIARSLAYLTGGMQPGDFELIVIANGCSDDTAERARLAAPEALVLETATPGKTNALRLGLKSAQAPVLVFLDADLDVTAASLLRLVAPLETGEALASHGRMQNDLTGCSALVRAFYAVWTRSPYLANGKFGGLFALSRAGLARIEPLPDVTADDEYISRAFAADEKAFVADVSFTAHAPRTLMNLLKVHKRSQRGTRDLARIGQKSRKDDSQTSLGATLLQTPRLWPAAIVYAAVKLTTRLWLALERPNTTHLWERDDSSRAALTR